MQKNILSLCDFSGVWSQPYVDAGYNVIRVDIKDGIDVRLFRKPDFPVHGILAAPLEGMSVVDACIRIIAVCKPVWWALENPVGRLNDYLGKPVMYFQPCDYGDPYTKKLACGENLRRRLGCSLKRAISLLNRRKGAKCTGCHHHPTAKSCEAKHRQDSPPHFFMRTRKRKKPP